MAERPFGQLRSDRRRTERAGQSGGGQAYGDGLAITEKLVAQDPSNTGWQSDLSASFDRIGDAQSARGNLEAALQAYGDGLAITEKLVAQDPSNTGWQRDLSVNFIKIGDVRARAGRSGGGAAGLPG